MGIKKMNAVLIRTEKMKKDGSGTWSSLTLRTESGLIISVNIQDAGMREMVEEAFADIPEEVK